MFGLFGANTPQYQGTPGSASQSRGGALGFLGRLFGGGGTPAYGGATQSYVSSGPSLFAASPQYSQPAPAAASSPDAPETESDVVEVREEEPPPVKAVTIIVKPGPGTTVEEVVDFFRDRSPAPRA